MLARIAAAMSLFAIACEGNGGQRHELEGLTVVEDFDDPICADTLDYLERRLRWLAQETGLPPDPAGLTYYWTLAWDGQPPCGPLLGCSLGREFFGDLVVASHEMAHSHLDRLGSPRVWLSEGMASMLEDDRSGAPHPLFTPSRLVEIDDARQVDYPAASAFTTYLRDRYGMPLLLDYYEASAGTDVDASLQVFEDVFGDRFADVEAEYLNAGLPDSSGALDCSGAEVAWGEERWEHEFRLSCDEPGAMGPSLSHVDDEAGTYLWSTVTLTAPAGWVSLELDASGPTWITLRECDGADAIYVATDDPQVDAHLDGGRYLVLADAYIADEPSARLAVRRLAGAPTAAKPAADPGTPSRGPHTRRLCSRSQPGAHAPITPSQPGEGRT